MIRHSFTIVMPGNEAEGCYIEEKLDRGGDDVQVQRHAPLPGCGLFQTVSCIALAHHFGAATHREHKLREAQ